LYFNFTNNNFIYNFLISLLFIFIFLITLTPNYALCQDNFMTEEEHTIWFDKAQLLQENFIKKTTELGDKKKILIDTIPGDTPTLSIIIENLKGIVKSELSLRKELFTFVKEDSMPSVELRRCLDVLESSVTTTQVFTDGLSNIIENNRNLFLPADIDSFKILKKMTDVHLLNMEKFKTSYDWSDSESEN
jgi:hypothetical protein